MLTWTGCTNAILIQDIRLLIQGAEEPTWRYIDPEGIVQGPFTAREMHTWLESNYLQMDLPICGMVCTSLPTIAA